MCKRVLKVILFFIILSTQAYGQKTIVGKVLNKTTHEPIPYANIGILGSNIGTISNPDGSFSILIPEHLIGETLFFTSLGFFEKGLDLDSLLLKKDCTVFLNEKAIMLQPVLISAMAKKHKDFEIGNFENPVSIYEPDTVYAGRAIALLIEGKNFPKGATFPVTIKKASLYIQSNNFETFKFRVRINKYDSLTCQPGEDLLTQSIIVESDIYNGWLDFDLSNAHIISNGPFFITFEHLLDIEDRTAIAVSFRDIKHHPEWFKTDTVLVDNKKVITKEFALNGKGLPGTYIGISKSKSALKKYTCFVRQTSMGEWRKVPMAITASVKVNAPIGQTPEKPKEAVVLEMR